VSCGQWTGPCRLYSRMCADAAWARRLYGALVEARLGLSRRREVEAAWEAAARGDPWATCRFLEWAYSRVPGSRVCVLGPAASGVPRGCDVVFGVQAPEVFPLDAVFTDLDSLWPPVEPEAAYRWVLVHVHGDNALWALAGAPRGSVYTNQAVCVPPVLGVGGFTDGDRPVVFALSLGAEEVALYGFPGLPYCGHKAYCWEGKGSKLALAREVIARAARARGYIVERLGETIVVKRPPGAREVPGWTL